MNTSITGCPICLKPVDPLRARHVGVRDGKIVAYCSAECQARAAAGAGAEAIEPAPTEPPPSGKRARTPASGVKATRTPASGVKAVVAPPPEEAPPTAPAVTAAAEVERRTSPRAIAAAAAAASAEVVADDPTASGIRRRRRRKDSLDARSGWEWLDDEPAEPVAPRRRGRGEGAGGRGRGLAVLLLVAVLGGGGYLAYRYLYRPRAAAPEALDAPPMTPPIADAAPPAPTPEQQRESAIERATGVLRAYATAAPPAGDAARPKDDRAGAQALARWMAAGALSRTGDAASIAILAGLLEKEPGELARLEIAYQLARAGDPRGTDRLVAGLSSRSIDTRHEAARWLARLGDPRAVPVLAGAMTYSQFRVQAAEVLAGSSHPGAIQVLEEIVAGAGANADEKARATIALGHARRATADQLRALLNDKRNAEAAAVLAELGDVTGKPSLYEQLALEHSCVDAARALRRFGDETDRTDGLRILLGALGGDGPTAQIRAAEAILLLAGPARWSERP
jgi:HEAT repeat protein